MSTEILNKNIISSFQEHFDEDHRNFLFKCQECNMIVSMNFDKEDFEKIHNNELFLECPCNGTCLVLLD